MTPQGECRIACVLAGGGFGGAERIGCSLAYLARQSGISIHLEAAPSTRDGLSEFELTTAAVETSLAEWASRAAERVNTFEPELVHIHLSTPSFFSAALRVAGKHPTLITLHLLPEVSWPRDRLNHFPSQWQLWAQLRFKRNLHANVVSRGNFERLSRWIPQSKLACIPNGAPIWPKAAALAASWPGEGKRLLVVGKLEERKGHLRLLRALSAPALRPHAWQLVVVGDGDQRSELVAAAKALGLESRVAWLGAVPAQPWLRSADLVIAASYREALPLVPLEAVSLGVPVALSSIPPHLEIFGAPNQGILPAKDEAWPAELERLLLEPVRLAAIQHAQQAVYHRTSPRAMWQRYVEHYRSLGVTGQIELPTVSPT